MSISANLKGAQLPSIYQNFRVSVDLKDLAPEVTHNLWRDVQNGDGRLNLLVTISGTTRGDSPSNLLNYEQDVDKLQSQWIERYVSKRWCQLCPRHSFKWNSCNSCTPLTYKNTKVLNLTYIL